MRTGSAGPVRGPARDATLDLFAPPPAPVVASRAPDPGPVGTFPAAAAALDDGVWAGVPGATAELAVPVAALTQTARDIVEGSLPPLWVRGEVSDFKRHRNGHWYFCLRDAAAQLRCVVWARDQRAIPAAPDDGMEVTALGQLTVYAARGELHLTVKRMDARGDGLWRKALEATRLRLDRDGLLAPSRKRPIPSAPRCVAVVTSPDGAAVRDVISVIARRAPHVTVVVSPARVQGDGAAHEICAALDRVGRWGGADVVIVGRGGGAREDLWSFNDEGVARAIAASPIPVISAVGHEIDVTISDLVADLRAATPSAAAEAAVPVRAALLDELAAQRDLLVSAAERQLADAADRLARRGRDLRHRGASDVERRRGHLGAVAARLETLSPLATLARGYVVARDPESGRTLRSRLDITDRPFALRFADGEVRARRVVGAEDSG